MILSIDLGTSKLCAAAVDEKTAKPLAMRLQANDSEVKGLADEFHEQDPIRTRQICFDLLRQVLSDPQIQGRRVDAIGISGQMHGVLLVDEELQPRTNLITWRDRREALEIQPGSINESLSLLDSGAEHRTGCRLAVGYGAATLRWLERNQQLPKGCIAMTIAGFIAAALCGKAAIDETHAASWGILDVANNQWDVRSVDALGIDSKLLPVIIPSGTPIGPITDAAKDLLGISDGAIICSPVGDCQSSVIGCAGFLKDTIVINIGTGAQISVPSAHPVYTDELDAWPMPMGGYLQLGAALCGGWAYAYLKQSFQQIANGLTGIRVSDEEVFDYMNRLAASAEVGADGIVVDTRFSGSRRDKTPRGAITGINTSNLNPANLSLAFLEGIVRELHTMWLSTGRNDSAQRVIAAGNAVRKNPALRSVIRRVFDRDCYVSATPEEAARGAAYAAAVGTGASSAAQITTRVQNFAQIIP
ncbi:MAG: hypothetical protein GX141_11150 [Armatimonadetes bacterium]|nr:hypothetical protein [Armatimonadota bacterium]